MLRTVNKLLCCKTSILSWFLYRAKFCQQLYREAPLTQCIKHCATQAVGHILPLLTLLQSGNHLSQKREMHELH